MAEPPFGRPVGAPESDSPHQTPPPEELRTPPETPGNSSHGAAPNQGECQNVVGNQGINDEHVTEILQSAGPLPAQPVTTGSADGSLAQHLPSKWALLR
jgi:hypothetical protein